MVKFETWEAVLAHVAAGLPVWYHAPLDYRPSRLFFLRVMRGAKIRIAPSGKWHSHFSFTADAGHLDRFRKEGV